jgi:ABC-type nitrate/sulfonate/bicarbonate transport system substrate-binding protein
MKRIMMTIILIITAISAVFVSSCQRGSSGETESIRLAGLRLETSALVYIAENQKYFSGNGLALTIQEYDTGVDSLAAVLKGTADVATLSEFVTIRNILQQQNMRILGTFNRSITTSLVALRSRGISQVADLAGKRIGLGRGTSAEFYLGRFLELNSLNIKDTVLVDLPPSNWEEAIAGGNVDAIAGWAPYTTRIQERFNGEIVNWQIQSDQPVFGLVVGGVDWIAKHPESIVRFWKALARAEEFLVLHPEEAKSMVQKRLSYDKGYIDKVWPQYTFSLSLDQPLILAMEDEARWMISNNLTVEKTMPNILDYIYTDGLRAAKPGAVKIAGKQD